MIEALSVWPYNKVNKGGVMNHTRNAFLFLVAFASLAQAAVFIDPAVLIRLKRMRADEETKKLPVVIHLKEQYDLSKLPTEFKDQESRGAAVASILENYTKEQIAKAFPFLKSDPGVEEVTPLWITNSVKVKASAETIQKMLAWDDRVESVTLDLPKPISEMEDVGATLFRGLPTWELTTGWGVEKVRAPELWTQGIKGKGILVAVIDSGANITHPDLAPNVWQNPGEGGLDKDGKEKATNGVDDDNDGLIDNVNGWNFENNTNDVMDKQGHGTQTAGLVGGMGFGGTQTGVAPQATLMILRACCDLNSAAGEAAIMQAMQFAVKKGVRVISMSLSIKPFAKPSYAKWRRASEVVLAGGVVHINSAGNLGTGSEPNNIGAPASNPPAWFHPAQVRGDKPSAMITIGATDKTDKIRTYSSGGPVSWESIPEYKDFPYEKGQKPGLIKPDVCGPSEVPSLSKDGKSYTTSFGGTSSATPQVAGVATLLLSARPDLNVKQVTEALQMSAVEVESPFNNKCGSGRVDAVAAVEYAKKHFK
jgi:subtilisin family serine protease